MHPLPTTPFISATTTISSSTPQPPSPQAFQRPLIATSFNPNASFTPTTSFAPATTATPSSSSPPPLHLLFDLSSPPLTRRKSREYISRFLYKLFKYPPPRSAPHKFVAVISYKTGVDTTVNLLTESPALYDARSLKTALGRLKKAVMTGTVGEPGVHVSALLKDLARWNVDGEWLFVPAGLEVASAIRNAVSAGQWKARVIAQSHVTLELDQVVGWLHELEVQLWMPEREHVPMTWRPRMLGNDPEYERIERLVGVRIVEVATIAEDVVGGWGWCIWGCALMPWLFKEGVALVCIGGGGFWVVFGGNAGVGLVKRIGGRDEIVPVPKVEEEESHPSWDGGTAAALGVDMFERGVYDVRNMWFGGSAAGGGGGGRVNFEQ